MAPRETENNAYAKFWDDKQRVLWYVTAFSGGVNGSVAMSVAFSSYQKACLIQYSKRS